MRHGKQIAFLIASICVAALCLSLLQETNAPIQEPSPTASPTRVQAAITPSPTPIQTPFRLVVPPTPDPNKPTFGPPEVIDDARAPQWLIKPRRSLENSGSGRREKAVWLFKENKRRVVPHDDARPFCVTSLEYAAVQDGADDILRNELGNWYRYQVLIGGEVSKEAKMIELVTDKSQFKLFVAISEYHPPEWREAMTLRLTERLGLRLEQIELVVAPREKTGGEEWVEGGS